MLRNKSCKTVAVSSDPVYQPSPSGRFDVGPRRIRVPWINTKLKLVFHYTAEEDKGVLVSESSHCAGREIDSLHRVITVPSERPIIPRPMP